MVSCQIWPKIEFIQILNYVLITCKYQKDRIETTKKEWLHHFLHYKSMGVFSRCSMADNPRVSGRNSNSSYISCIFSTKLKLTGSVANEKKWRHQLSYAHGHLIVVRGLIWSNFELIQALMCHIVTCKYEKDPMKNSKENVMMSFSPL